MAGVYLHEIGHAVAGWIQGIAMVPTPAKEYILQSQVSWNQEIWISLGGPVGTTLAVVGATLYFLRERRPEAEAVLLGALLPLSLYTIRFVLAGRGHDGLEWQAAQTALGLAPAGHAIDVFFLCLWLAGIILWGSRLRLPLRYPLLRLVGLTMGGVILLSVLQVGNNRLFDRHFPDTKVPNIPSGLDPASGPPKRAKRYSPCSLIGLVESHGKRRDRASTQRFMTGAPALKSGTKFELKLVPVLIQEFTIYNNYFSVLSRLSAINSQQRRNARPRPSLLLTADG